MTLLRPKSLCSFAIMLLVCVTAAAQTADEIVDKYVAARGGISRLNSIRTARLTGVAVMPDGKQWQLTEEFKRPGKVRTERVSAGVEVGQSFDGNRGWQYVPPCHMPQPLSGAVLENLKERVDFIGPLADYKVKGHRVELLGKEEDPSGGSFYKLKLTMANGTVREELVDTESFLVTGMRRISDNGVVTDVKYSDWREVTGVKFAYRIESRTRGATSTLEVAKYEVNVPIDDSRFTPPDPAVGADNPKECWPGKP